MSHWRPIILGHIQTLKGTSTGGVLESLKTQTELRADWIDNNPVTEKEAVAVTEQREAWEAWGDGVAEELGEIVEQIENRIE